MPARRALVIGLNAYKRYEGDDHDYSLHGCVNDARVMAGILREKFDFPEGSVTLLLDEQATKDGILDAFDALIDTTGMDDVVVFYFAGHGSQLAWLEKKDKAGGYTTALCPFDVLHPGEVYYLIDDEIHERLLDLADRTSYITVIIDACHSATMTRDAFGARARSMPVTRTIGDYPLHTKPRPTRQRPQPAAERGPSGWLSFSDKYVLIAGCRDEEKSYELEAPGTDEAHGALTYFLSQELSKATSGTSYRDIFERVAANVSAYESSQHPQMEGRIDRAVFGVQELLPMDFARIASRAKDRVKIDRGAAHGVTMGSTYDVLPQGTKRPDLAASLGTIEITSVGAVQSDATIVSETTPDAIAVDSRAFESAHAFGGLTKLVEIVPSVTDDQGERARANESVAALTAEIGRSRLVAVAKAENARSAFARAYLIAPRTGPSDPVPQLGAVDAPTWAVVGTSGHLLFRAKRVGEEPLVRENLEKAARYVQALDLDNPNPRSALRGKFTLDVMRRDAAGVWMPARPESSGGLPVLIDGEAFAFRVTSMHGEPAYISLLDFQEEFALVTLFPAPGAAEKIAAGKTFEQGTVPAGARDEWILQGSFAEGQTEQQETIKLFVTSTPADFSLLTQAGTRGLSPMDQSPITALFRAAIGTGDAAPAGTRAIVPSGRDPDDWTTVTASFVIRRNAPVEAPAVHTAERPAEHALRALNEAIAETGGQIERTIRADEGRVTAGAREMGGRAFEFDVPARPDAAQFLLSTDADGLVTFHFPQETVVTRALGDAAQRLTFRVPIAASAETETRDMLSAIKDFASGQIGSQVMELIIFPVLGGLAERIGENVAQTWESSARPYRVRRFSPDDYSRADVASLDADGWKQASNGRALLFLHDTFDRSHGAFAAVPRTVMSELDRLYEGRVFAFDHFTLSHDPRTNAKKLVDSLMLPEGMTLDVDIVAHGRGGLVARALVEGGSDSLDGAARFAVRKVLFVGTPNAGTPFADVLNIEKTLNRYTALASATLSHFGGPIAGGLFGAAKSAAFRMASGLKGISAMKPGGDFLDSLKTIPSDAPTARVPRYLAIASDFQPQEPGIARRLRKLLADRTIVGAHDLIVSTKSAVDTPARFPVTASRVLPQVDGVAHAGYFGNPTVHGRILEWLRED